MSDTDSNAIPVEKTCLTTLNASSHAAFRGTVLFISIMAGAIAFSIREWAPSDDYSLAFLLIGYLTPSIYIAIELIIYFKIMRLGYEDRVRDQERARLTQGYPMSYEDRIRTGVREDMGRSSPPVYMVNEDVTHISDIYPVSYQTVVRK